MADHIKTTFIEALRTTPEGILDFLATPLPTPPTISAPADVDAAIIANGICAKYVLDLFTPFAGLTPIELLLRIGQHNNVLEAGLLAGLEYIGAAADGTNAQNDLVIIDPVDGTTFAPGNLRLQVQATNGQLLSVSAEQITGGAPFSLEPDDTGVFWGFLRAETPGDYTVNVSGRFAGEVEKTATAAVTISDVQADNPENPEGADWFPVETSKKAFDKACAAAVAAWGYVADVAAGARGLSDLLVGAAAWMVADREKLTIDFGDYGKKLQQTIQKVVSATVTAGAVPIATAINRVLDLPNASVTQDDIMMALADLKNSGDATYSAATQEYFKKNQHPGGGYTTCPEVLAGAAAAMNDKYGPGTVSYGG